MKESDPHSSPIKSPKQLIIVVLLAFVVPIVVIVLVTQLVTGVRQGSSESEKEILSRIKAVGNVVIGEPSAAKGNLAGDAVYGQVCKTCHDAGLAGAPKIGDKSAWGPRVAQGQLTVTQHAVNGFQGKTGVMPPKGGNADLTDTEVGRAVVYMANQAGANWKEPAAPAAATTAAAAPPPSAPPQPHLQHLLQPLGRRRPQPPQRKPTERKFTTQRVSPATVPASPARRSLATNRHGLPGSQRAITLFIRMRFRAFKAKAA